MNNFLCNIAISFFAFASWYLAGLGPALILLARSRRCAAFLLAPLVGMSLLTLLGLLQITVLLTPLIPRINMAILALISLLLCFWVCRGNFQIIENYLRCHAMRLWLVPLALLLMFGWMFHHSGFQLLVGGSDQIQYCQNARQIREVMHTRSALDIPVARQDHFVYEMTTRTQPYMKDYRRGAEVMLATTSAVTGLSYEEAFPVTLLCALLTLGLALGFLGRDFLRLSMRATLLLQITLLSSFYLLMAHLEGSLALLMSLALNLVTLALLSRVIRIDSWRWLLLTSIVMAACISIYAEPTILNIFLPSILLVLWELRRSWMHGCIAMRRLSIVYLIVFILAPFAVYTVIATNFGNLCVVCSQLWTMITTHIQSTQAVAVMGSPIQQWSLAAVLLGATSYYDASAFNAGVAQLVAREPWLGFGFFILGICGMLGYFKVRNRLGLLFAASLVCWMLISLIEAHQQDSLRFIRSLQYATPFALIGLIVLASRNYCGYANKWNFFWIVATWIGRIVLTSFVFMNLCTSFRTVSYLASHTVSNDHILLRFDERGAPWQQLQAALHVSALHNAPVLISGFCDTIHPLALAVIMRLQPHVLGTSILSFWPIYYGYNEVTNREPVSRYNTRFTQEELQLAQQQQSQSWSKLEPHLIQRSEQAVVPVGNGYPIEWLASADVYAPRMQRFTNVCDVMYRKEYSVTLPSYMTSRLEKDAQGPYRLLWASGSVIVHDHPSGSQQLVLEYAGNIRDVRLKVGDHYYTGQALKQGNLIKLEVTIVPNEIGELHLIVNQTVKLRSMAWTPLL